MSGAAALNPPSYSPALFGSASRDSSLLASLYDNESPGQSRANPIAALDEARSGEVRQIASIAAQPQVKRDMALFMLALASAVTPAQSLASPPVLKVLLTANGLADQVANAALAREALLSDPSWSDALVNKLPDTRWLRVNKIFAFATRGLAVLKDTVTSGAIAGGYAAALWRTSLDRTTPGLSTALDFVRRAATITSVNQVLSDPTFRAVILPMFDTSQPVSLQAPITREQAISSRIDLAKFSDPVFVDQLAHGYLIAEQQAASENAATPGADLLTRTEEPAGLIV